MRHNSRLIELSVTSAGSITVDSVDKVEAVADQGTVKVDETVACNLDGTPAKWLTKKKAIVIVGAGAPAGTAAGVAKARRGPPFTSPGPPPVMPPVSPH